MLLLGGESCAIESSSTLMLELELPLLLLPAVDGTAEGTAGVGGCCGGTDGPAAAGCGTVGALFVGGAGGNRSMIESSASMGEGVHGIVEGAHMSLRSRSGVEGGSLGSSIAEIV